MARIAGVQLPKQKRLEVALTAIYGIGPTRSGKILQSTDISPDIRVKDLSEAQVQALRSIIEKDLIVEGDLRRETMMHVKRLKEINCYRGMRHIKRLPARGQRTKTNSRTIRGNKRVSMGSGRK